MMAPLLEEIKYKAEQRPFATTIPYKQGVRDTVEYFRRLQTLSPDEQEKWIREVLLVATL